MSETTMNETTHIIIAGTRFNYIKKLTRAVGFLPRMDAKDEANNVIAIAPVPWLHISGIVTEAEMEPGEERDYLRVFGLFTIDARKADGTLEHFISRNMILTDLEDYFQPKLEKMTRRPRKGGPTTDYFGLPDFMELRFDLELWLKTPETPNRRGYDVDIREVSPTVRSFILDKDGRTRQGFVSDETVSETKPDDQPPTGEPSTGHETKPDDQPPTGEPSTGHETQSEGEHHKVDKRKGRAA